LYIKTLEVDFACEVLLKLGGSHISLRCGLYKLSKYLVIHAK